MDERLAKFNAYATHPWLRKVYARLRPAELAEARAFIVANAHLDRGAFEMRVNRLYLDRAEKPRHLPEIQELLTCCNSA